ncbi:MAG: ATP-binding cassette domain-containing protein [Anaerolineae bacterium]
MSEDIIEVQNLVRKFGEVVAVDNVSFTVKRGEIFGFLGPNGAGKTTTINVLCTLLKPTSGGATVNGYDATYQQDEVRRSIGLVFQDPSLDEHLTAQENLDFHATLYNVPSEERGKRIEEVLGMVELYDRRNDQVETFSGGMKRRLEIARGLMHYPRVLFLDEPTLGLDPQTRRRIWDYILELRDREDITIFMTTHYMDEAEHADRIAIIDYGRIIALDTPEALKRMVGGDIITVRTSDNGQAAVQIRERYGVEVRQKDETLFFEVEDGESFIPEFITNSAVNIAAISLRRPTLDDVFLKLTGREIRERQLSEGDKLRQHLRTRRRFHRGH